MKTLSEAIEETTTRNVDTLKKIEELTEYDVGVTSQQVNTFYKLNPPLLIHKIVQELSQKIEDELIERPFFTGERMYQVNVTINALCGTGVIDLETRDALAELSYNQTKFFYDQIVSKVCDKFLKKGFYTLRKYEAYFVVSAEPIKEK